MDFKTPYVLAMRERVPGMFNRLARSGRLEAYLQERSVAAHRRLDELVANEPKRPNGLPVDGMALRVAKERVMAEFLEDFPDPDARPQLSEDAG